MITQVLKQKQDIGLVRNGNMIKKDFMKSIPELAPNVKSKRNKK